MEVPWWWSLLGLGIELAVQLKNSSEARQEQQQRNKLNASCCVLGRLVLTGEGNIVTGFPLS